VIRAVQVLGRKRWKVGTRRRESSPKDRGKEGEKTLGERIGEDTRFSPGKRACTDRREKGDKQRTPLVSGKRGRRHTEEEGEVFIGRDKNGTTLRSGRERKIRKRGTSPGRDRTFSQKEISLDSALWKGTKVKVINRSAGKILKKGRLIRRGSSLGGRRGGGGGDTRGGESSGLFLLSQKKVLKKKGKKVTAQRGRVS